MVAKLLTAITLPAPCQVGVMPLEQALRDRRSTRTYTGASLALDEVSQLLWAAQGITAPAGLRTAPSPGAVYPLRVYLVAAKVEGLAPGIYAFDPEGHRLELINRGDKRRPLMRAANDQQCIAEAAALIAVAVSYYRITREFGDRGIRLSHIETGHVGQNVCLQATTLGLGVVTLGAFDDAEVKKALRLPPREDPVYLLALGRK